MNRAQVLEQLYAVCAEMLGADPGQLTEATHLYEDLDADSLDVLEMGVLLEARLGIELSSEALDDVRTIGQAADLTLAQLG